MHRVALAEWILALTVAPDRAATTVGDLVEDASRRGALWFWSSVLRTALSHLWRDLNAAPFRLIRLALWGWMAQLGLTVLVLGLVFNVSQSILNSWGPWVCQGGTCATIAVPNWAYSTGEICFGIIIFPLLVGWWVADRSRGKELGAAFAINFGSAAIHFLFVYLSALQMRRIGLLKVRSLLFASARCL